MKLFFYGRHARNLTNSVCQISDIPITTQSASNINRSPKLIEKHGEGWSVETLTICRKIFNVYSNFVNGVYEIEGECKFTLSWSHYLVLMRIKNADERRFYEIETTSGNWSENLRMP